MASAQQESSYTCGDGIMCDGSGNASGSWKLSGGLRCALVVAHGARFTRVGGLDLTGQRRHWTLSFAPFLFG